MLSPADELLALDATLKLLAKWREEAACNDDIIKARTFDVQYQEFKEDRLERLKATVMPKFDRAISFDTIEADEILAAFDVFPPDNPWNIPVD